MNELIATEIIDYHKPENIKDRISEMNGLLNLALKSDDYKAAVLASDGMTDALKRLEMVDRLTKPFQTESK